MTQNEFKKKYENKIDNDMINSIMNDISTIVADSVVAILTDIFLLSISSNKIRSLIKFNIVVSFLLLIGISIVYINNMFDFYIITALFISYIVAQLTILYKMFERTSKIYDYIVSTYIITTEDKK